MSSPLQRREHFCSFIRLTSSDLFRNFLPLPRNLTPSCIHSPPPTLFWEVVFMVLVGFFFALILLLQYHLLSIFLFSLRVTCWFPFLNFSPLRSDLYSDHPPKLLWVTHDLTLNFNDFSFSLLLTWLENSSLKTPFKLSFNEVSS